jgi:hypothetical protein
MSQLTANSAMGEPALANHYPALRRENVYCTPSGMLSSVLGGAAILGLLATVAGGFVVNAKHAYASFHIGIMSALAMTLGALFLCLFMQLVNAGWYGTIRRQLENIASLAPVIGIIAFGGVLFDIFAKHGNFFIWAGDAYDANHLLEKKSGFLNQGFFVIRGVIYIVVWTFLASRITFNSRRQDATGDWKYTQKTRFMSTYGLILFAFCTAFAAFDWLMSPDFRFFSTMWGVYYFAGAIFSAVALLIIILSSLRSAGKLEGVVTEDHFHDVGKLMLSFTVFWSYIAFSQYFLIWYSNIPEETAWFVHRTTGAWKPVFQLLCIGHFVIPFLVLLLRNTKRNHKLLRLVAVWAIFIHVIDLTFIVRPMVYVGAGAPTFPAGNTGILLDLAGPVAALSLLGFLVVRKIGSGPLVPLQDPRMSEAMAHKNYV